MTSQTSHSELPDFQQRQAMWASVSFAKVESPFPAIGEWLDAIRPLYANGTVVHAAFTLPDHPVFQWYAHRKNYYEMRFLEQFWGASGPKETLPYRLLDSNSFDQKIFSSISPFHLGGTLAWMLADGGAYHSFDRGGSEAKRLGEAAGTEMLGGDYGATLVVECHSAWNDFFWDVAWDHTIVAVDSKRSIVHTILTTDTD